MDTTVAGLNKVYCYSNSFSYAGYLVTITDGTLTWEKNLSNSSPYDCTFLIPSMPAPAKNTYTVKLYNGTTSEATTAYTRTFELGFGDSVRIWLALRGEPVDKQYFKTTYATDDSTGTVQVPNSNGNGVFMSGSLLRTREATETQLGCVRLGRGFEADYSGKINIKTPNMSSVSGSDNGVTVSGESYEYCTYQMPTSTTTRDRLLNGGFFLGVYANTSSSNGFSIVNDWYMSDGKLLIHYKVQNLKSDTRNIGTSFLAPYVYWT